jgi:RNA polymerase sigma-70 factor (ECF subfamily)
MDAKQVFEILMRENTAMLLAFLRSAVRDRDSIDDLYQEAMLVAWRRLEEFDRTRPFGPWLRGIAGKLILAHYRTSAQQGPVMDQETLDWLENRFVALHDEPGDSFVGKLAALRECVNSLPESYRLPIQMRYHENMSLGDIGETLSIALGTLKKRLTRAKQQLAGCLERKLLIAEQAS